MNQIPNIEETLETYFPDDLRMRAYYYGFKSTGIRDIDKILSAVAIAGKAFHSTDQWIDEMYEEGVTAEKLIQYAADTAALHIHQQLQKARESERELVMADINRKYWLNPKRSKSEIAKDNAWNDLGNTLRNGV